MSDMEILRLRIAAMRLKPGDIVVLQSDAPLRARHEHHLHAGLRHLLPDSIKHIILGPGFRLSKLTPAVIAEKLAEAEG